MYHIQLKPITITIDLQRLKPLSLTLFWKVLLVDVNLNYIWWQCAFNKNRLELNYQIMCLWICYLGLWRMAWFPDGHTATMIVPWFIVFDWCRFLSLFASSPKWEDFFLERFESIFIGFFLLQFTQFAASIKKVYDRDSYRVWGYSRCINRCILLVVFRCSYAIWKNITEHIYSNVSIL